jgi:hypothetical protein
MKKISRLKRFLLAIVAALLILCLILFSGIFQVGSYPYAQEYKFDVPAEVLYDRVEKFKAVNLEYNPPKSMNLLDSFEKGSFSHIYLFYVDKNTIVHLFISGNRKSSIYFEALNNLSNGFKWNHINKDFDRSENLAAKKELQQRFLDKLNLDYKDNGNSAFVFWK